MPRNYNNIYSKLIENEFDILGHIAYAIYKQQKIAHIEEFKIDNKRGPSDQELIPFNKFTTSEASIDGYRIKAERILQTFTDTILEDTFIEIEEDCKKNQSELLKEIIKPIEPPSRWRRFFNGVLQSIVGAFVFSLIIATFVIINQTRETGIESVIENTFDVKIEKVNTNKHIINPSDTIPPK
ncbi:MAG: hypothetical protein IMY72_13105 [Bacteroidetes bacterium]|nr:hypothetical protein [Bacteroidota bacterium]